MKRAWFILLSCMCGCAVGPNYAPPRVDVPDSFSRASTQPSTALGAELAQWWKTFDDPVLDGLVGRAVNDNLDLKIAAARVREARAARGIAGADLLPTIDANGSYQHSRRSLSAPQSGTAPAGSREHDLFEVGFDSTWEIDVFGGIRRAIESADASVGASIENQRDVLVTLVSEVARNYVELRARQRQLAITQDNLKSQRETLDLTTSLNKGGLSSELDVVRARALAENTAAQIPAFEQAVEESIHRLGVLLGRDPAALDAELGAAAPIPQAARIIATGVPSELLRRRPDIRRAERELASFTAEIGVATADLFPHFSLTGSLGLQASHARDLGKSDSLFYGIGPSFSWTIFDWGRIRSRIEVADARTQQSLIGYRQTVLLALEETENALVAFEKQKQRRQSLVNSVDANRRAVDLANQLFTRGLIDYLSVQETQRNLLLSEDQLAQSDGDVSASLIALYKALGGGWEPPPQGSVSSTPNR